MAPGGKKKHQNSSHENIGRKEKGKPHHVGEEMAEVEISNQDRLYLDFASR